MAFKFNEVNVANRADKNTQVITAKMNTIKTKAQSYRYWAGFNAAEAQQLYRELYDLGDIVTAHFFCFNEATQRQRYSKLSFF
jgi:hypothetical protein